MQRKRDDEMSYLTLIYRMNQQNFKKKKDRDGNSKRSKHFKDGYLSHIFKSKIALNDHDFSANFPREMYDDKWCAFSTGYQDLFLLFT